MTIIGGGRPGDRAFLSLETKKRHIIPNEQRMERASKALKASIKVWEKSRPNAHLRSITATYNCMGLVFASRRTCIDPDELRMIFEDDGYEKIPDLKDVDVGDVVVYFNEGMVTHVGIVVGKELLLNLKSNIIIMSKWGADGEYLHEVSHVPDSFGRKVEYWTDRKRVE